MVSCSLTFSLVSGREFVDPGSGDSVVLGDFGDGTLFQCDGSNDKTRTRHSWSLAGSPFQPSQLAIRS
jgi:hypothetical protein